MIFMKPYYQTDFVTLYHGDNLKILKEIDSVDFVYTDPPYNANKKYGPGKDNLPKQEYIERISKTYEIITDLCDKWITHIPKKYLIEFLNFLPKGQLVIVKRGAQGPLCNKFHWTDKFDILYSHGHPFHAPPNLWENIRLKGEGYFFREKTFGHFGYTPRPIAHRAIKYMTKQGNIVLDPYAGTGTTLIEAAESGRHAIGIEYEKENCDIIIDRLRQCIFKWN